MNEETASNSEAKKFSITELKIKTAELLFGHSEFITGREVLRLLVDSNEEYEIYFSEVLKVLLSFVETKHVEKKIALDGSSQMTYKWVVSAPAISLQSPWAKKAVQTVTATQQAVLPSNESKAVQSVESRVEKKEAELATKRRYKERTGSTTHVIKKAILDQLQKGAQDTKQLAQILQIGYSTASKALCALESEGKCRKQGNRHTPWILGGVAAMEKVPVSVSPEISTIESGSIESKRSIFEEIVAVSIDSENILAIASGENVITIKDKSLLCLFEFLSKIDLKAVVAELKERRDSDEE